MAISFIGATSAVGNSGPLPTHIANDYIIAHAYRALDAVAIILPAGWAQIQGAAANSNADLVAWKKATSSAEVSGTWTNAQLVEFASYRGVGSIGASSVTTTNTTIPNPGYFAYQSLALTVTDGTSWVLAFAGIRINTQEAEVPPSGMVNRANQVLSASPSFGEVAAHDTNGGVSSWAGGNGGVASGNRRRLNVVELVAAAVGPSPISGSFNVKDDGKDKGTVNAKVSVKAAFSTSDTGKDLGLVSAKALARALFNVSDTGKELGQIAAKVSTRLAVAGKSLGKDLASVQGLVSVFGAMTGSDPAADRGSAALRAAIVGSLVGRSANADLGLVVSTAAIAASLVGLDIDATRALFYATVTDGPGIDPWWAKPRDRLIAKIVNPSIVMPEVDHTIVIKPKSNVIKVLL